MSDRRYFSGDSEAQALIEAAIHFGVEPEELAFQRVEKKHGFVRRRKRVMIEVDPADPRGGQEAPVETSEPAPAPAPEPALGLEPGPAAPAPQEKAAPPPDPEKRTAGATPAEEGVASSADEVEAPAEAKTPEPSAERAAEERDETGEAEEDSAPQIDEDQVRNAVDLLLDLADLDVQPQVRAEGGDFHVNVTGPEREWLLEEEASLLFALEHLTLRMLWQQEGRFSSLRLDSDGYRETREAELRKRAQEEARRVLDRGEAVELEALDPAERRIVHLAVQELEGVESHSRGRGFRKRVRIVRAS